MGAGYLKGNFDFAMLERYICIERSHLSHLILMPTSFCCSVSFPVSLVSYAIVTANPAR
jgi:hypothetical protein